MGRIPSHWPRLAYFFLTRARPMSAQHQLQPGTGLWSCLVRPTRRPCRCLQRTARCPPPNSTPFPCTPWIPLAHAPLDLPPGTWNRSTSEQIVRGNQRRGFIDKNPNESTIVMNSRIISKSRSSTAVHLSSPPA
jgi:hypothetical protein